MTSPTHEAPPRSTAARRVDELLAQLAERLGAAFSAERVFGAPVERDGVTVVPVAAVRYGLGGGAGEDPGKQQEGAGAGAAGTATPVGYIELKEGRSRYVPIVRPARMLAILTGTVLAGLAILRPVLAPRPAARRFRR